MGPKRSAKSEIRTIIFVDAVNFTQELKQYGRSAITPKINQLRDFTEFFFVYKLKGEFIGQMGDGFLVLCPPTPAEVINEAVACQSFIKNYNSAKEMPDILNTRIAIHYGMIAPSERGNYIDTNLNLTARLEGATPPNAICISSVLFEIVSDVLRGYAFKELKSNFKGLGENKYYSVSTTSQKTSEPTRRESRLSFYFSTIDALRFAEDWEAVRDTCEQALIDFPDNLGFTSQLAFALYVLGDYVRSIRLYEQCIQMDYEVGDSLLFIGRAYRSLGNDLRAIEIFEEAGERDSEPFHALGDLASIYLEQGDYDQAIKWSKKSLKVNRNYILPVAIQIVIALIRKKNDDLEPLIKKIETGRHSHLREDVEVILKVLYKSGYFRKLDLAFKAAAKASKRGG